MNQQGLRFATAVNGLLHGVINLIHETPTTMTNRDRSDPVARNAWYGLLASNRQGSDGTDWAVELPQPSLPTTVE